MPTTVAVRMLSKKNAKMAANLDKGQWPIRAATFNPIGREYLIREGFVA
jgi:hypothetical protein